MNQLRMEDNKFIYCTQDKKKELLNCSNYLSNKSRIPMHSRSGLSILNLLQLLLKAHPKMSDGTVEQEQKWEYLLMDVLLVKELISTAKPVKVLEFGCMNGVLSYHLSTILGMFHEESELCCVCDELGNDSGNRWLDRIAMVENPPGLSMLAADYDRTNLAAGHFDLVFINGSVLYNEPYQVIKEAERVVKQNGVILCYCADQPLLEDCFRLVFEEREEYSLSMEHCVITVRYHGVSWEHKLELESKRHSGI